MIAGPSNPVFEAAGDLELDREWNTP